MSTIRLKSGHVRPLWAGHPWVFAPAIAQIEGAPKTGDWVKVIDPEGKFVGHGFYSKKSAIAVRLVSRHPDEAPDLKALIRRLERAAFLRSSLGFPGPEGALHTDAYRLVNAEGDDLPGLTVDVFGEVAVVQVTSAGMERHIELLYAPIQRLTGVRSIARAAVSSPNEELETPFSFVRGPERSELAFVERGLRYVIPIELQQKTGFYLDQRDVRALLETVAHGRVLDAYSYVGAMGLAAARGEAREVLSLDSSASAVAIGAGLAVRNKLGEKITFERGDVKRKLPALVAAGERFETVVIDPPKLIPTRRHRDSGRRAYLKLNELACSLTSPGGLLLTCSCSAAMNVSMFIDVVGEAAARAGRSATLLRRMGAGMDHPTQPAFREGRYLKSLLLRIS